MSRHCVLKLQLSCTAADLTLELRPTLELARAWPRETLSEFTLARFLEDLVTEPAASLLPGGIRSGLTTRLPDTTYPQLYLGVVSLAMNSTFYRNIQPHLARTELLGIRWLLHSVSLEITQNPALLYHTGNLTDRLGVYGGLLWPLSGS